MLETSGRFNTEHCPLFSPRCSFYFDKDPQGKKRKEYAFNFNYQF